MASVLEIVEPRRFRKEVVTFVVEGSYASLRVQFVVAAWHSSEKFELKTHQRADKTEAKKCNINHYPIFIHSNY